MTVFQSIILCRAKAGSTPAPCIFQQTPSPFLSCLAISRLYYAIHGPSRLFKDIPCYFMPSRLIQPFSTYFYIFGPTNSMLSLDVALLPLGFKSPLQTHIIDVYLKKIESERRSSFIELASYWTQNYIRN